MSELRPSFQERDRYLDLLSTAYADGRLDEAEFQTRSDAVLAAVTHRDAMAQFQGLPQPDIVPVAPTYGLPQPGPPQAFQPRPVPRRGLMAVAVGVAAVVGLGAAGLVFMSPVSQEVSGGFPDPMMPEPGWVGGTLDADPMFFEGWAETSALLRERGLDSLGELRITVDQIAGVAAQARAPGETTTFSRLGMGPIEMSESSPGGGLSLAELDMVDALVQQGLDHAGLNLTGAVSEIGLEWSSSGEPLIRVTATDGVSEGWVLMNADQGVVEFEPVGER